MTTAILLRTWRFGPREAAFCAQLQAQSGYAVHVLADETQGMLDTAPFGKVSLTPSIIRGLGLLCPADFGWRCGDYCLYAARQALPTIARFWLIEPDVRANVDDYGPLFHLLDGCAADFMAPNVIASSRAHFWWPTMRWVTPGVFRCDFAFSRMSAAAADLCLAERRRLARLPPARIMWPNDETFVTTTLRRLGLTVRDVNECGAVLATAESFGFFHPHRGEDFAIRAPDGLIYHPVLWGEDYERKLRRVSRGASRSEAFRLKILRGLARGLEAGALVRQAVQAG